MPYDNAVVADSNTDTIPAGGRTVATPDFEIRTVTYYGSRPSRDDLKKISKQLADVAAKFGKNNVLLAMEQSKVWDAYKKYVYGDDGCIRSMLRDNQIKVSLETIRLYRKLEKNRETILKAIEKDPYLTLTDAKALCGSRPGNYATGAANGNAAANRNNTPPTKQMPVKAPETPIQSETPKSTKRYTKTPNANLGASSGDSGDNGPDTDVSPSKDDPARCRSQILTKMLAFLDSNEATPDHVADVEKLISGWSR